MEVNARGYDLLIKKLDQFIRKYYVNKLIRGVLYTVALLLALFLLFNLLEHYFYFNKGVRKLLFSSYIITSLVALAYWVLLPLYHYLGLGKVISHEQAAHIIGDHFGNVKDKLLNVLQLAREKRNNPDALLLAASVEQKTESIKLVPFQSAIDLSQNKKYLRYALPPLLMLIVILFAAPSLIKDSTSRIINNDIDYERAAPFSFLFEDDDPRVLQNEDYQLEVNVEGDVLPNEAFIEVDNFQYRLTKKDNSTFTYTFRNLNSDTPFRVFSGRVSAAEKEIKVLAKPSILDFDITLDYPGYTGRKDEIISNVGDISVPEGTRATWSFNTAHTESVALKFGESQEEPAQRKSESVYDIRRTLTRDQLYQVLIDNSNITDPEGISYSIAVKKDEYPVINVERIQDSIENTLVYFVGNASDDYGISGLNFHYTISDQQGRTKKTEIFPIEGSGRDRQYTYTFDINTLELAPGDKLSYYFEVKDNDAVNGRKSAKTGTMNFEKPTVEDLKNQEKENSKEIKENLKKSIDNMKKLQEKYKKLREELLQKKELDWQDKKELEKLLEEQKEIQEKLEKAQEKFKENLENSKEIQEKSEEVKEKEEKLNELFEEALDDEKQDLLEKIEELLQELQKENSLDMMEQMEQNNENKEMDMNRLLELYKQLEVEKEAQDIMDELEELAEKQEELAEKTENKEKSPEELKKEQEELNEQMEDLKEQMEDLEKKNEELKRPKELGEDNEEQMEDIQEDMENSGDKLEQQDNEGAAESQKKAAEKMKKMASGLQESMAGGDQNQQQEDAKLLRQLLENLVTISYDQEDLADNFTKVSTIAPQYVDYVQTQFKLKDDFKIVEDSLVALANRNDQIQGFVLDKVSEVKVNMTSSIDFLEERKTSNAMNNQRRSMTGLNDLALMLSESLENMQQSMAQSMPGSQMCNKPGSNPGSKPGKVPGDKISEGQDKLGEKLQQMMQNQKNGKGNSSKDFAEAAARQAAMRKALQDMQKNMKEQGEGSKELEQIIDEMNKNEIDLVNKRLDGELLKRQQDITTRLLEADKAERKREYDNKRKAETATEIKRELPPSLKEYLKKREAETEMYKTVSPELRPYYRNLVDDYYRSLKKTN